MAGLLQNLMGMGQMTDQVIATDFLLSTKTGIKNIALALSETASPEIRETLLRHFDDAVKAHERITNFMLQEGYYQAFDPQAQMRMDIQAADTALQL